MVLHAGGRFTGAVGISPQHEFDYSNPEIEFSNRDLYFVGY